MSRQFRHRVTAVVMGGFLLGAPLLMNGTANAGQVESGDGRQVVFGGGDMLGFSCQSAPDVESMTVPAESKVTVVNRTGHNARLLLGGSEKGVLADDSATQVVFNRGSTPVILDPDCTLSDEAAPAVITAAPATGAAMPGPIPVPASAAPAAAMPPGSDSTTASATAGSSLPDSPGLSTGRPQRATVKATRAGTTRAGGQRPGLREADSAAQAMPQGGAMLRIKTKTGRSTAGAGSPGLAGMPLGGKKVPASGVPSLALAPATEAVPAAPAVPATEIAAAEPVAAVRPMAQEHPIGLLALVAAVCAIGVGVGAIRSFVAQRAYRSPIA